MEFVMSGKDGFFGPPRDRPRSKSSKSIDNENVDSRNWRADSFATRGRPQIKDKPFKKKIEFKEAKKLWDVKIPTSPIITAKKSDITASPELKRSTPAPLVRQRSEELHQASSRKFKIQTEALTLSKQEAQTYFGYTRELIT